MLLSLVAAVADNGVIGDGLKLPWHLPADLAHFKAVTLGKPVLMGSRTFAAIGRALPGRRNLVLTRGARAPVDGVEVVRSLEQAVGMCQSVAELCVIGGAQLYALALPGAARMYLTRVHARVVGDVRFPDYDAAEWRESARSMRPADERNGYALTFLQLERVMSGGAAGS